MGLGHSGQGVCKVWKVIGTSWQEAGSAPELGTWTTSGLAAEPRFSAPGLRFCLLGFLKGQPTFHLSIPVPLLLSCGLVTGDPGSAMDQSLGRGAGSE